MREAFIRVLREQQYMLGVTVRGIGATQDVGLLRARGHAGAGPAALHVDYGDRNFGKVGQTNELGHQRDAGAGGGSKGACAIPACAHHHANRGQLVLGLHDGIAVRAGLGVDPEFFAVFLEGFGHRGAGCDRVPGGHRGAAIDQP